MKKLLFATFILTLCIAISCNKKDETCSNVDPKNEEAAILAYAAANGITPVKHASGLHYQIVEPGSGVNPALGSIVSVKYTGRLLDNSIFDSSDDPSKAKWPLNRLIQGWQIGIPLIKKGGKIKLLVPSAYGYGCTGSPPTIPGNAILMFDVELVDVQ